MSNEEVRIRAVFPCNLTGERAAGKGGSAEGRFTVLAVVDGLTQLAREERNANDRTDRDNEVSRRLVLAS